MDFRQLETLAAVIETGGFTRASERLYLTQPTVTAHINSLEAELGQQLLIRSTRGIQVTDAGKCCYGYAKKLLKLRNQALSDLGIQETPNQISVATSSVPGQYLLPKIMSDYRHEKHNISFSVIMCDSTEVSQKVESGLADIGFCGAKLQNSNCIYKAVDVDKLVVITPPNSQYCELAGSDFPCSLLTTEPFISREVGSGTRQEFEHWLYSKNPGANMNIIAEMDDPQAIKRAVSNGMGIAVISECAAIDYIQAGLLFSFTLPDSVPRSLYMVKRKKSRLSPAVQDFYAYALNYTKRAQA